MEIKMKNINKIKYILSRISLSISNKKKYVIVWFENNNNILDILLNLGIIYSYFRIKLKFYKIFLKSSNFLFKFIKGKKYSFKYNYLCLNLQEPNVLFLLFFNAKKNKFVFINKNKSNLLNGGHLFLKIY